LGVGAWAVDLHDANPTEGIPVGAAVWTGLSMVISAFVGGYMTARFSGSAERGDGLYHGVVLWGVNWLVFVWLTTTAMATMIGGPFAVFGMTLQTVAQGLSHGGSGPVPTSSSGVSLSIDDLRREIDSVVRVTGRPETPPERSRADATRALSRMTDQ